jgi:type VI secretion system protein
MRPRTYADRLPSAPRAALAAAAAALLVQVGCGGTPAQVRLQIEVSLTAHANQNSPIPVSFVAVKDPKFLDTVLKLNAKQWFEQREQLHRDDPSGQLFTEWEWEYVPGHPPPPVVIEVEGSALAALVFANYRGPGDHRLRIAPARKLRVELGDEDVAVRPIDDREP